LDNWNTLLSSSTEESYDALLEEMNAKHPQLAMAYCTGTWLALWKEKLVAYWVNKNYHFGVVVTSPIEGCHATLKSYLQRGNGDLRGVFVRMQQFWDSQHIVFKTTVAQQQLWPKHSVNIPIFAAVLQHVHGYALQKIIQEHAKLPTTGPPISNCSCTIQFSFGLPCYHTIWRRKINGGVILLDDIHRHWHYYRPSSPHASSTAIPRHLILYVCRVKDVRKVLLVEYHVWQSLVLDGGLPHGSSLVALHRQPLIDQRHQ
jgi:hypothetical protein